MTTVYKRLKLHFHALLELLRNLLLGWLELLRALPLLKAILERRLRPLFVDRPRVIGCDNRISTVPPFSCNSFRR
jgi:hypothetical protein